MAMAAYIIGMQELASLVSPKKELLSRDFLSSSRMTLVSIRACGPRNLMKITQR
jgi:hypothetical protein